MKSPAQPLPAVPSQPRLSPFPLPAAPTATHACSPQPRDRDPPGGSGLKEKPTALHRLAAGFANPAPQLDRLLSSLSRSKIKIRGGMKTQQTQMQIKPPRRGISLRLA